VRCSELMTDKADEVWDLRVSDIRFSDEKILLWDVADVMLFSQRRVLRYFQLLAVNELWC
jgi:hypothetical protein